MHLCHSCLTPLCPAQSASTSPLPEPVGQTRAAPPRNSVAVFHPIDSPLYIIYHNFTLSKFISKTYQSFTSVFDAACVSWKTAQWIHDVLDTAKLVSSNVRRMEPGNQFFVSKLVAFAYSYVICCACLANLQLDRSRCSRLPSPDLGLWTPTHQWWSCDIFVCCSWGRWQDNAWLQTLQPCVEIHVIYYIYILLQYILNLYDSAGGAWPYSYEVSERRIRGKPQQNVKQIFTRGHSAQTCQFSPSSVVALYRGIVWPLFFVITGKAQPLDLR